MVQCVEKINMSTFWEKTLPLLYKKGLSQADISRIVDRPRSTVSNWIKRDTEPSASESVAIAKELGVSVEFLTDAEANKYEGMSELKSMMHKWIDDLSEEELQDLDRFLDLIEAGAVVTSLRNKKGGE